MASEDIGLADSSALTLAVSALQAYQALGKPEGELALAHCAVYLARAPKSNAIEIAYQNAQKTVQEQPNEPVPIYLRNAATKFMKAIGYGADYKYNHDFGGASGQILGQSYLPPSLAGTVFLEYDEAAVRAQAERNRLARLAAVEKE